LTNIGLTGAAVASGNTTAQFTATSDIAIEFDRPIATVTKAQLRFYRDSEFFTPIDSYKLSDDKTVLYITPANMLAPNETFVVRLAVTAADGQQIVYDSTNTGDSTTWANGAFYNQDLRIRTKDVAIFTGIPIGRQPASGGTLATTPATGNIGKTETSMSLVFTAAAAGFQQDYAIYVRRFDVWNTTTPVMSNITVNQGQTAPAAGNPLVVAIPDDGISSPYNHTTGENIQYKARGINNYGYVAEATSRSLPFAP
jgi:hypothetical protein